jgi:VanZ family protein
VSCGEIPGLQDIYPMNIGTSQRQPGQVSFFTWNVVLKKLLAPLVMAGIWFLSSQSTLPKPKGILGIDKVQHFIAYFVLAAAIGFWFFPGRQQKWRWKPVFVSVVIAAVYGVIDEVHQYFVPGRECSVWDWLADSIGAVFGSLTILFLFRVIGQHRVRKAGQIRAGQSD